MPDNPVGTALLLLLQRMATELDLYDENQRLKLENSRYQQECRSLNARNCELLQRRDTRIDLERQTWTWLQNPRIEEVLKHCFINAAQRTMRHYNSGEVSITAALGAYLCNYAERIQDQLRSVLEEQGYAPLNFDMQLLDCQRQSDVGGADFVIILEADIPDLYRIASFTAFQAKKLEAESFSISEKEGIQLKRLLSLTQSSYYLFYPAIKDNFVPPLVVPARTINAYLAARMTRTVGWNELGTVALGLDGYLLYDFLPGWSGDQRSANDVEEFVTHVLVPMHLLRVRISPTGEATNRRMRE